MLAPQAALIPSQPSLQQHVVQVILPDDQDLVYRGEGKGGGKDVRLSQSTEIPDEGCSGNSSRVGEGEQGGDSGGAG